MQTPIARRIACVIASVLLTSTEYTVEAGKFTKGIVGDVSLGLLWIPLLLTVVTVCFDNSTANAAANAVFPVDGGPAINTERPITMGGGGLLAFPVFRFCEGIAVLPFCFINN